MLRRYIAFLLLICHINTSMLLPQVPEADLYGRNGEQLDDINSVTEYVDEVIIGNKDTTPEDEDDDNGQNFLVAAFPVYTYQPFFTLLHQPREIQVQQQRHFPDFIIQEPTPVSTDIIAPPPEA